MNIGIDIRTLSYRIGGISQYCKNILNYLSKLDTKNTYFLYSYNNRILTPVDECCSNLRVRIIPIPQRWIGEELWESLLPLFLKIDKIDLFLGTDFFVPKSRICKKVGIVYDTIFLTMSSFCDKEYVKKMFKKTLRCIRYSHKIITISQHSKKDILNRFSLSPDKIEVIYPGVGDFFKPIEKPLDIKHKYSLPEKFFLFVGEISKRKNIISLVKAVKYLGEKVKEYKIVLIGKETSSSDEIFNEIKKEQMQQRVVYLGYIPDKDLLCVYNLADIFVFLSLYEGFGMPLLEAMACGVPVIASNTTAIPEVVGDAGMLVDPQNVSQISECINEILTNRKLKLQMREKGLLQAKKFSWYDSVLKLKKIMEEL